MSMTTIIPEMPDAGIAVARAIGVSRVSEEGDRGERLRSFNTQRERMALLCDEREWTLTQVHEERDVSGGKSLASRPGLLAAVEAIENGEASVLVVAFKNRLDREPAVRDEVIDRVEAVGGLVWTADAGRQTNETAVDQFTGTTLSAADRMMRRQAGERSRAAVIDAVAEGIVPWSQITPGYRRGHDRRLYVVKDEAKIVNEAFKLRAKQATIAEVRAYLAAHGIHLTYRQTQSLLRSTLVLGRIDFGKLTNEAAHDPIVKPELWKRVQAVRETRGPRAGKSDRLLARLGVLRCETCGGGMIASKQTQNGRAYPFYRCAKVRQDCAARAAISADMVEQLVIDKVLAEIGDDEGTASVVAAAREAASAAAAADEALRTAVRTFTAAGIGDEEVAVDELAALRARRDAPIAEADRLESAAGGRERIQAAQDWDRLSVEARRELIVAVVDRVVVTPGRGADRVAVHLRG